MKSLILTLLYLAKDTVNRWFTRISSPLARVLVVFFLSLSALSGLGSYAISTKLVKDKIMQQGGNLVFATISAGQDVASAFPTEQQVADVLDVDSYVLLAAGSATTDNRQRIPVYSYDFCRSGQFFPLLASSGIPTILATEESNIAPGPNTITIQHLRTDAFVRRVSADHPIIRMSATTACMLVQPDLLPDGLKTTRGTEQVMLRVRELNSSADVKRIEDYLRRYIKLEERHGFVLSASSLLGEMDVVLSKQTQCRVAFCVGISAIVGILLTALAGMEYRQNEYIYTLMKSFGIHPFLLVSAFIGENIVIVGASFAAALATFMHFQHTIVTQILKLGDYSLTLQEIMPEVQIICYTLLACIFVSAIPIMAAAHRDIGRVLK